jgi:hypothetical protein
MKSHPECSECHHDVYEKWQESGVIEIPDSQLRIKADMLTTKDIISTCAIGNISCCMFDAQYLKQIPDALFDLTIGDWMFKIYYSTYGSLGRMKEIMSVYRKHKEGVWSGKSPAEQARQASLDIDAYNRFLKYKYNDEFSVLLINLQSYPHYFQTFKVIIYFKKHLVAICRNAVSLVKKTTPSPLKKAIKRTFSEIRANEKLFHATKRVTPKIIKRAYHGILKSHE